MRIRWLEVVRGSWGAALLVRPAEVLVAIHGIEVDDRSILIARILGARHLTQALLSGVDPSPEVLAMGCWVDGAHAVSALALAAADTGRARGGIVDASVAATFAGLGFRDLWRAWPTAPGHDRIRDLLARGVLHLAPGGGVLRRRAEATRRQSRGRLGHLQ